MTRPFVRTRAAGLRAGQGQRKRRETPYGKIEMRRDGQLFPKIRDVLPYHRKNVSVRSHSVHERGPRQRPPSPSDPLNFRNSVARRGSPGDHDPAKKTFATLRKAKSFGIRSEPGFTNRACDRILHRRAATAPLEQFEAILRSLKRTAVMLVMPPQGNGCPAFRQAELRCSLFRDTIAVGRCQEQNLVIPLAQNDIEMVEDVAAKDTQVGGFEIGEGSELAAETGSGSIPGRELEPNLNEYEFAGASNSLKRQVGRRRAGRNSKADQYIDTQDVTVSAAINEEILGKLRPVRAADQSLYSRTRDSVVTHPPFAFDDHRIEAP